MEIMVSFLFLKLVLGSSIRDMRVRKDEKATSASFLSSIKHFLCLSLLLEGSKNWIDLLRVVLLVSRGFFLLLKSGETLQ